MTSSNLYDVAVVGAGIGGYVSAIRLSQLGKRVALIEKDKLGGMCLNWGCIPTKTLLATADFVGKIKRSEEFGVHLGDVNVDFGEVMARKNAVLDRLIRGVQFLIEKNKIQLVEGEGRILSRNQIRVLKADGSEEIVDTENIIIATGSEEAKPSYADVDGEGILTCRDALRIEKAPESLTVIGAHVIGIEFAVIFSALGTSVRILEASQSLLPGLDSDIGRNYQRILKKKGIELQLGTEVLSAEVKPNGKVGIRATAKGSDLDLETEKALITDGRRPVSNGLGLDRIGVQTEDGFIVVDEHLRTSVSGIYAVGDVTGGKMFAHVAIAEGIAAAENIAGLESTIDYSTVPTCIYCQPEIASVGLSESEAKEQGFEVAVGKFPLLANGRALALGEADGFAKVVSDAESGEILGVHLIAPHATDMIGEASLAVQLECTPAELGSLIHPHPTISEALMEAARAVSKKAIHM